MSKCVTGLLRDIQTFPLICNGHTIAEGVTSVKVLCVVVLQLSDDFHAQFKLLSHDEKRS